MRKVIPYQISANYSLVIPPLISKVKSELCTYQIRKYKIYINIFDDYTTFNQYIFYSKITMKVIGIELTTSKFQIKHLIHSATFYRAKHPLCTNQNN